MAHVVASANPTCTMWFQRVVEMDETELDVEIDLPKPKQQKSKEKNLLRRPTGPILRLSDFQRVKLMSKISQKQRREQEYRKRLKEDLYKSGLDENQVDEVEKIVDENERKAYFYSIRSPIYVY